MAENVQNDKKVVKQPTGTAKTKRTSTTGKKVQPVGTQAPGTGNQEENTVQTGQGNGQPQNGQGDTVLDTQNQGAATGTQGSTTDSSEKAEIKPVLTKEELVALANEMGLDLTERKTVIQDEKGAHLDSKSDKERRRIADGIFENNPVLKVVYFTSNLVPFSNESDAHAHASTLKDKTVYPILKS